MPQASNPYLDQVAAAAVKAGIDPRWAQATLLTENAPGDPNAESPQGAEGVMQVLPSSAPGVSLGDPTANIATGVAQLAANLKATGGDKSKASAMYFAGPSYSEWGPKTHAYVAKVAENYNTLGAPVPPSQPAAQPSGQSDTPDFDAYVGQAASASSSAPAQSKSATPDFDAFVNQAAPATPSTSAPAAAGPTVFRGTLRGAQAAGTAAASVSGALGRIGSAAVQGAKDGFGSAPIGISPQTTAGLQRIGIEPPATGGGTPMQYINKAGINTVAPYIDTALRGAQAVFQGAQAGAAQAGTEVGQPLLGRDIAALPEAFAGSAPEVGAAEGAVARDPAAAASVAVAEDGRGNALTGAPAVPQPTGNALTASAVPQPQSVGAAATPAEMTPLTPREQAGATNSDNQARLNRGATPGDATIYVPGSTPTAADVAGNAAVSLEEKQHRFNLGPEKAQQFSDLDRANNDARVDYFDNLAGNDNAVKTLQDARSIQAEGDLAQAWGNKQPTDAQPVMDTINSILAGPSGKLSAVKNALGNVKDILTDSKGNLETDPEVLYGVRKEVANMLGKNAISANPTLQDAASQLGQVKDALDATIEQGAPGYGQYLQNYASASKPIDTMQYLQSFRPKILNSSGQMSIAQVHGMMRDITSKQMMPGANAAKNIDPDTLGSLWNLHSDMVRMNNRNLGKAAGSDTVQNASVVGQITGHAASAGAHFVAGHIAPGFGNMLVEGGKTILKNRSNAKSQQAINARTNQLLYPPEVYGSGDNQTH